MSDPQQNDQPGLDPDADPEELNPRDLRDTDSEDGARSGDEADTDADPETLNPAD
ncbi:hypothetical protein [Kineococcus sp. SYSU DK003]|uniref:hypothetical protein n=1 Tax=Kineococcus sp. SYSU DK003 TaxID=3383124 RepID=UPI003D7F07BF